MTIGTRAVDSSRNGPRVRPRLAAGPRSFVGRAGWVRGAAVPHRCGSRATADRRPRCVEESNLHRQRYNRMSDLGAQGARGARRAAASNPAVRIDTLEERLSPAKRSVPGGGGCRHRCGRQFCRDLRVERCLPARAPPLVSARCGPVRLRRCVLRGRAELSGRVSRNAARRRFVRAEAGVLGTRGRCMGNACSSPGLAVSEVAATPLGRLISVTFAPCTWEAFPYRRARARGHGPPVHRADGIWRRLS